MNNSFDFTRFNECVEKRKVENVSIKDGYNYALMVIQNRLSISSIDFSKFTFEDLADLYSSLDTVITDEDLEGHVSVDPEHPYTKMWALSIKILELGTLPKQRPASPYLFI